MNGTCYRVSGELREKILAEATRIVSLANGCGGKSLYLGEDEYERVAMLEALVASVDDSSADDLRALLDQAIAEENR